MKAVKTIIVAANIFVGLIFIFVVHAHAAVSILLSQGDLAHEINDFARAAHFYRLAAVRGNAEAMTRLGDCYEVGEGVIPNEPEAMRWYLKAAGMGDYEGQFAVGENESCGCGGEVDLEKSARYLALCLPSCRTEAAADQGSAENDLAVIYEKGWAGLKPDKAEAILWFSKAAAHNSSRACYELGVIYADTDKARSNKWYGRAFQLYKTKAEHGSAGAQTELAYLYENGLGTAKDLDMSREWRLKASASGQRWAINLLGAEALPKDPKRGLKMLERSAGLGEAQAAYRLALAYNDGHTVTLDTKKAEQWLLSAAKLGNLYAQTTLADDYDNGRLFRRDRAAADRWRHRALEQALYTATVENTDAKQVLLSLFNDDRLSEADHDRVFRRLRILADWGDVQAKRTASTIGWFYELHDPWPDWIFGALLLAPIFGAWVLASVEMRAIKRRVPADPAATLFNSMAGNDLFGFFYLGVFIFGPKALGYRVFRPYVHWVAQLYVLLPKSNYRIVAILTLVFILVLALAGWLAIRASLYRLENTLKDRSWSLGRRYLWVSKGQLALGIPLILVFLAYMVLKIIMPASGVLGLLLLAAILILVVLQPLVMRKVYGMTKLVKGSLVQASRRLAKASGVNHFGFFLWDTDEAKIANAMVMGTGDFNRQVILTTVLAANLNPKEQQAVLAHEFGHIKLKHIFKLSMVSTGLMVFLLIPGASWIFWAALILLIPLMRRHLELEADAYAVKMIGSGVPLASALTKISRLNCTPATFNLYYRLFASHPSLTVRLEHIQGHCLACHASNRVGAMHCAECGTKLPGNTKVVRAKTKRASVKSKDRKSTLRKSPRPKGAKMVKTNKIVKKRK